MPVSVEIADREVRPADFARVAEYLTHVDTIFSTYKENSEISRINRGEIASLSYSKEMKEIFALANEAQVQTKGFFNIKRGDGTLDPSGLVKGWAIQNASVLLINAGLSNFYIDIGGDVATSGKDEMGEEWSIGVRNPFARDEIIKLLYPKGGGVATSGTYIRGEHIYNPHTGNPPATDLVSLTVVGPHIYEADLFATAAFAMGKEGMAFIENRQGYEGYAVDRNGTATMTSGFEKYTNL